MARAMVQAVAVLGCARFMCVECASVSHGLSCCFPTPCRCADMPLSQLNRRRFCHVVGIIPGPKEPINIDPYLERLLQEFKQYGPSGKSRFCWGSITAAVPCGFLITACMSGWSEFTLH